MAIEYYCAGCGRKISTGLDFHCRFTHCPYCFRPLSYKPIYIAIEEQADRIIFLPFLVKTLDIEGETFMVRKSIRVGRGYVLFLERNNLLQAKKESNANIQN